VFAFCNKLPLKDEESSLSPHTIVEQGLLCQQKKNVNTRAVAVFVYHFFPETTLKVTQVNKNPVDARQKTIVFYFAV